MPCTAVFLTNSNPPLANTSLYLLSLAAALNSLFPLGISPLSTFPPSFLCKWPDSKHFRFYRPHGLYHNDSAPPLQPESRWQCNLLMSGCDWSIKCYLWMLTFEFHVNMHMSKNSFFIFFQPFKMEKPFLAHGSYNTANKGMHLAHSLITLLEITESSGFFIHRLYKPGDAGQSLPVQLQPISSASGLVSRALRLRHHSHNPQVNFLNNK